MHWVGWIGLGEGEKFALKWKAVKGIYIFFSIVGLLCFVLILLLATVLDPWAALIWIAVYLNGTGRAAYEASVHHLHCANTCSNVVWQLHSVSAYGCWEEKGELLFVRLPKRSNDSDAVLSVSSLHASLQKEYKAFYYHLGLWHF